MRRSWLVLLALCAALGSILLLLLPRWQSAPEGVAEPPVKIGLGEPDPVAAARLRGYEAVTEPVDARVRGKGIIQGQVLDEDARPVSGVAIRARREWEPYRRDLLSLPPPSGGPRTPQFEGQALSDAGGRFRLSGLEEGVRTWIWALPAPPYGAARALATPNAETSDDVTLHIARGSVLRGRVVDAEGRGVAAWIDAEPPFREQYRAPGTGVWCVCGLAMGVKVVVASKHVTTPPRSQGQLRPARD